MERNRTRKTTGFWPWLLSDGLAQRGQNEGVAPLLLSVDGGGTSETGGAVSPPGCLRSRRRRRPPRAVPAAWRSPGWWTTQVSACALSRPSLRSVTPRSSEQWVLPYGTYLIRVFAKEALILGTLDTVSTGSDGSQV